MNAAFKKIALGLIFLIAVYAAWENRGTHAPLQIVLAIAFTFAIFTSLIIHLGRRYRPARPSREAVSDSTDADLVEEGIEPEEADAIIVEAQPDTSRDN